MSASKCVLLTSTFPIKGEVFLRYEIPYLAAEFDKVEIVSTANRQSRSELSEDMRRLKVFRNVEYLGDVSSLAPQVVIPHISILRPFVTDLWRTTSSATSFKKHLYRFVVATRLRKMLLDRYKDDGMTVFYSYWMNASALALASLGHVRNTRIARAHGSDIYDENIKTGYNSYTQFCLEHLDKVFSVSEHGRDYMVRKAGFAHKVDVARLGVQLFDITDSRPLSGSSDFLKLLSCSAVDENKRVQLIVDTLKYLGGVPIKWTHIGDGPLLKRIAVEAASLPANIETEFFGQIDNHEIHKLLKEHHYDIFLNTSLSEGIPVAAMEAMSYGIPCIATDVGGTRELVGENGGWLVSSDVNPSQLAATIKSFQTAKSAGTLSMTPKEKIKRDFNAETNFLSFSQTLKRVKLQKGRPYK